MIKRVLNKMDIPANSARFVRMLCGAGYPTFLQYASNLAHEEYEGIVFDTPSALAQWRGRTHLSKEPGTIKWLDELSAGDVLYDIGANIGVYSLYAAAKRKARVFSFEPSPFNFSTLSRNVVLNQLSEGISAFCLALSDKTVLDKLYLSSVEAGAAHTGFQKAINEFGGQLNAVHAQATLGFTIDEFINIFSAPVPKYIKIDVDGAEGMVIAGAKNTLNNKDLKSILIELPSRREEKLPDVLGPIINAGFEIVREDHPDGDVRLTNYILKRP